MIPVKIKDGVYSLRANDWDRKLFDELVPLPDGTSYNAYLIKGGDKTALIDTVYPAKTAEFIAALKAIGLETIDYVIANHAELDHAGSIPAALELFPKAKVVANARCWRMMCDMMPLDRRAFLEAKDGSELSLGGKTLKFVFMPWVHWPETMGVFLKEDRIFFPCDFLGAHLAASELAVADAASLSWRPSATTPRSWRPTASNAAARLRGWRSSSRRSSRPVTGRCTSSRASSSTSTAAGLQTTSSLRS